MPSLSALPVSPSPGPLFHIRCLCVGGPSSRKLALIPQGAGSPLCAQTTQFPCQSLLCQGEDQQMLARAWHIATVSRMFVKKKKKKRKHENKASLGCPVGEKGGDEMGRTYPQGQGPCPVTTFPQGFCLPCTGASPLTTFQKIPEAISHRTAGSERSV